MVSHEDRNTVRLDVSNFGPIAEASVDLRPLTVFVGPSNTGKTYLAILTYALHRFFGGASSTPGIGLSSLRQSKSLFLRYGDPFAEEVYENHEIDALMKWLQRPGPKSGSRRAAQILHDKVASVVRRQLRPSRDWDEMLPGELARCFGAANANRLIRQGTAFGAKITLKCLESNGADATVPLKFNFDLDSGAFNSRVTVADPIRLRIANEYVDSQAERFGLLRYLALQEEVEMRPSLLTVVNEEIAARVGATMVSPLSTTAHYLPADRTGTIHAHRALVGLITAAAPIAGLGTTISLPSLSGVYSDFLFQLHLIGASEPREQSDPLDALGARIEAQILSGEIRTDRSNPTYPIFSYLPNGWDTELPMMNASSMVSELAPVVLFLRHVVKPGEVLIIEEPESNLHPAMQVEFMRQLAAVVNSGVRIMITTHSEWILDELANLVRLSELPPEKRTPRLKNEPALDPRDVGVWLFERGKEDDGSRVKELPFDVNEGGFATGYEDTARLTYNQWAAIHNLLQK